MMFLNENEDSDQSISEDEDVDYNWSRNVVSLGSASEDKGNIQILSHLETLKDVHNLDCATKVTIECQQRQKNICIEDDVEHPVFNNEEHFGMASGCNSDEKIGIFPVLEQICCSEEEIISEDEIIAGSVKCKREGSPSRASGHTEAALYLNENSGSSSACGKLYMPSISHFLPNAKLPLSRIGNQGKTKHKFLFRFNRKKEGIPFVAHDTNKSNTSLSLLPQSVELDTAPSMFGKKLMEDLLDNMQQNEIERIENDAVPSEIAVEHKSSERSMAELLDCFQEKRGLQFENSINHSNIKGRRVKHFPKRNISALGDRNVIDDDIPEALDSEPSMDAEEIPQVLKSVAPERTIADQFHEALGSASKNDRRPYISVSGQHCGGLFANLQRVMLSEKERDINFSNHLQMDTDSNGEKVCIDVRILSSSLEAKLTICHCTFKEDDESADLLNHPNLKRTKGGSVLTVIFSSRVCNDVELDKGNLIRIYPPWKEVHAKENDEVIILSRYFSRISSDHIMF
ncbi:PREDICTED: uncharacterized protein LOC109182550 isoform X2 [Ipomoea nil]|uniref:uncharacterized protein LOC109182550 isoform X2 n=1 Tax=Ipomoea nil TaxID=35883 RepID=UPI000900CAE9|nr:PREDICTED: uncharacterized protein LOC109182550 isoform X2 [Ipomoea nil]